MSDTAVGYRAGAGELSVRNPRTGRVDARVHCWSADELGALAGRQRAAQPAWADLGTAGRADVLVRWAGEVAARRDVLVEALAADTGRWRLAANEVATVGGMVAAWTGLAERLLAPVPVRPSATAGVVLHGQRVPYGLIGVISPWNFPLLLSCLDAIPALAAGCAVIVKPSEVTPRFVAPLMDAVAAVPELAGVLSFVTGDGTTGAALIDCVDGICFTGSVATGRKVAEAAARRFIPAFLELGGKDPAVVLPSADPARAAAIVLRAAVQATGQACQSVERVYVHERIAAAFTAELVRQAEAVELNHPDIHAGHVGPLIFARQAEIIAAQLEEARARGARVLCGGAIEHHGGGAWMRPTVVVDVTHDMALMQEETFGPVIPVMTWRDAAEVVAMANDSVYGLSAAVIGDEDEAVALARQLDVGAVSINDGGLTTEVFDAEKTPSACRASAPRGWALPGCCVSPLCHRAGHVGLHDALDRPAPPG